MGFSDSLARADWRQIWPFPALDRSFAEQLGTSQRVDGVCDARETQRECRRVPDPIRIFLSLQRIDPS